jgi:hypothetical protein
MIITSTPGHYQMRVRKFAESIAARLPVFSVEDQLEGQHRAHGGKYVLQTLLRHLGKFEMKKIIIFCKHTHH